MNEGRRARSAIASKASARGTSTSISALTGPIGGAILVEPRPRGAGKCVQSATNANALDCRGHDTILTRGGRSEHLYQYRAPPPSRASQRERLPAPEPFSASPAAPSSRSSRTTSSPTARAAAAPPSAATRSSSRCRTTAARPPSSTPPTRPARPTGWPRRAPCWARRPRRSPARDDDGEIEVLPIERGWTRIGRSAAADIRLDDPSVSRRHALIVSERPKALRVLDDRSLNGVHLNGELVEWARLADGDELAIGRYRLFVLEA